MMLVEDVAFSGLDNEQDASGEEGGGLGSAVGGMRGNETSSERRDCSVRWKRSGYQCRRGWIGCYGEQMSALWLVGQEFWGKVYVILMEEGDLRREATEGRGNGVEFHLTYLRWGGGIGGVNVDHVVGAEESE